MHEVRVMHDFNFAIDKVFAGVSDHAGFLSTSKITCLMKRDGQNNANGKGACVKCVMACCASRKKLLRSIRRMLMNIEF